MAVFFFRPLARFVLRPRSNRPRRATEGSWCHVLGRARRVQALRPPAEAFCAALGARWLAKKRAAPSKSACAEAAKEIREVTEAFGCAP